MGFWSNLFRGKTDEFPNTEPNKILDVGVSGVADNISVDSVNWSDKLPNLVIPSINNIRKCASTPLVNGILNDFVVKSISGYVITGDNEEAVEKIREMDKEWHFTELMYDCAMDNLIDGTTFYNIVIDENTIKPRKLAFDGDNYRMKILYDDTGLEIIGYVQRVLINNTTNKGWLRRKFFEINDNTYTDKTVHYHPDEISNPTFLKYQDKPRGIVVNVLDTCYIVELLKQMLPQIVYKQSNTMFVTLGNKDNWQVRMSDDEELKLVEQFADYHKKGVIFTPYGISPDMVGETVLPRIQDYIDCLTKDIYAGLISPEAIFSASSSNRSTAIIQLDSEKSGRVLMQEFIQECLSRWLEEDLINPQLELWGLPKDSVWIEFNPESNTGAYLEDTDNDEFNKFGTDTEAGTNMENIRNGEQRVEDMKKE